MTHPNAPGTLSEPGPEPHSGRSGPGAGAFATGRLLVVSPHFDDAALSCAALLSREEPVDVLTVFGGDPDPPRRGYWDACCGFESSTESRAVRHGEERAAFLGTPHRPRGLLLLEGQYLSAPRRLEDRAPIREAISSWCDEAGSGVVALPAGAGVHPRVWRLRWRLRRLLREPTDPARHPDHLFVRDAGLPVLARRPGITVLLYEELPYLSGAGADRQAAKAASSVGAVATRFALAVDRAEKAERLRAYGSQIGPLSGVRPRLDTPEGLPAEERYWRLDFRTRSSCGQQVPESN